jgi:hypothetical protein
MKIPTPVFRRLRGYAFDPSLSIQMETAMLNETIFNVPWESGRISPDGRKLEDFLGPVGEYVEVVDYDPASGCFYPPVDLNHPTILAQDGLFPSESDPQFHQQMVYAVTMTTIKNFERALGRRALWALQKVDGIPKNYVQRLRIYPHAMREANAFYSPNKVALLFGYFPASSDAPEQHIPGGIVFTCLSHDIIAHETTHALLDGMHRRYIEANHPDALAFHEAFADVVALFQHFSFPEVLHHQIAKTRGDLASQNILGELAQQFGQAIGHYGALRDAIGRINPETKKWELQKPDPNDYLNVLEPHARGSILVAAIFDAFLAIYKTRITDLLRIATSGTGVLPQGEIHPDLVNRLADEAANSAQQVLGICIRALDYCPPVDITFGDYLRAIITADFDLVPDDKRHYRVAFIEAFRRRGIYPRDIRSLSEDSLIWERVEDKEDKNLFEQLSRINLSSVEDEIRKDDVDDDLHDNIEAFGDTFREFMKKMDYEKNRQEISRQTEAARRVIHGLITQRMRQSKKNQSLWLDRFERLTGLVLSPHRNREKNLDNLEISDDFYKFEVHSLRGARRGGPPGKFVNQQIISITQTRHFKENNFKFRGGCTLILDLEDLTLRYVVGGKRIDDQARLQRHIDYQSNLDRQSLQATYFGKSKKGEPFAFLHRSI